jgi:hypothetical protein
MLSTQKSMSTVKIVFAVASIMLAVWIALLAIKPSGQDWTQENPKCVNGFVVTTPEFGGGFCRTSRSGGWGFEFTGCQGFGFDDEKEQFNLHVGTAAYRWVSCYDTTSED